MKTMIIIMIGIALKKWTDKKITEKYGKRITQLEQQITELKGDAIRVHIRSQKIA